MKLIIRADDVGYSKAHNIGSFQAIDNGVATAADVMFDTPGAEEALRFLKERPWISVGWHVHLWGSPLSEASSVPTLIREDGHFRRDIMDSEEVSYDEILRELYEEMDFCASILGYTPRYMMMAKEGDTPFLRAMSIIQEEFGIASGFASWDMSFGMPKVLPFETSLKNEEDKDDTNEKDSVPVFEIPADARWSNRKIYFTMLGGSASMTDALEDQWAYDPLSNFLENAHEMLSKPDDRIYASFWHPGCVDSYVMKEGDEGVNAHKFILCRPVDTQALCDERLADWIVENHIELVNFTDALFGMGDYQSHLRRLGSRLAYKNRSKRPEFH